MKLFQYWDSRDPPDDVARCIASVRELNPEFEYRLFDRDMGSWFVGKHLSRRHKQAFDVLAVPAMQADYLRLCALWTKGGLWNDVDNLSVAPFSTLIAMAPGGYLSMLDNVLQTDVIYAPTPHSPYFAAVLELATRMIERREQGDAYNVTGPRLLNLIWAAIDAPGDHPDPHLARDRSLKPTPEAEEIAGLYPGAAEAFAAIERRHDIWTAKWARVVIPAYKASPLDWRNWDRPIYTSLAGALDP